MAKPTTRQAFKRLITEEDYLLPWLESGYSKADRARYRNRLRAGLISEPLMEQVLLRCGYTVAVEKQWNRP